MQETRDLAIIVDEAHSSQTGDAEKLKRALADTEEILKNMPRWKKRREE